MNSNLGKRQSYAIAAIVLAGILVGALILKPGSSHDHDGKHPETPHGTDKPGHGPAPAQRDTQAAKAGLVALDEAQARAAGIAVSIAGAARINAEVVLPGEIRYNEDRTAHVVPRLGGVVESVPADLGQNVRKGQVLAVIASTALSEQRSELLTAQKRLSLARTTLAREKRLWEERISAEQDYLQARQAMQEAEITVQNARQKLDALGASATSDRGLNRYEVRAPFDGMVMEKHLSLGEAVKEDASIFTIADLSTVWAEVAVPAKDLDALRVGANVTVSATAFPAEAAGTIAYVGSLIGEQTRTAKARIVLANPDMSWRPGLYVNVAVSLQGRDQRAQADAAVAVSVEAIQAIDNKPTVFLSVPGGFLAREVTLGRSDGRMVEVTKGLAAGAPYASANSFILKAELGKAGAGHTH